ncbi:MAG: competence/damage-inducible protein A [Paracoccaceae bacterium]
MANPTAAILVIGDEILSGRTKDANLSYLADKLTEAAIDLREARVVADDHEAIIAAVRDLSAHWDHVFTSGGIGPTHDDITADAIAEAFGATIDVRSDARALLAKYYRRHGIEMNEARLRMARIPAGAALIDNPISVAPGFTIGNVHVMAGVPMIFQVMVVSVLATLRGGDPILSVTMRIRRPEGEIAKSLGDIAAAHDSVTIGSYPFMRDGRIGTNIVVRSSDKVDLNAAVSDLETAFPEARKP